jgi:hypothetical protein
MGGGMLPIFVSTEAKRSKRLRFNYNPNAAWATGPKLDFPRNQGKKMTVPAMSHKLRQCKELSKWSLYFIS